MHLLPEQPLPPGSVIGIVGGGQLGRMIAIAAAEYGYHAHIYTPQKDSPAADVSRYVTCAGYDDEAALIAFAQRVQVITVEFENIPARAAQLLAEHAPFAPNPTLFAMCQHRLKEKEFVHTCGVGTAPFQAAHDVASLRDAVSTIGTPCIVKQTTDGYDGKGQMMVRDSAECEAVSSALSGELIVEKKINFLMEASVIVARSAAGDLACFPVAKNDHVDGILYKSVVPNDVPPEAIHRMEEIACQFATSASLVGLLAIECFILEGGQVLINEMAPRPHNSGHWTMDGCNISQFHQLVRAITGWPLILPLVTHATTMTNIIGHDATWEQQRNEPAAHIYLYGKSEIREGRKMGHVNRISALVGK